MWLALFGCPFVTDLDEVRDFDGDGHDSTQFGGDDCDDRDKTVFPGAPDDWYDGALLDCDRADDYDQDLDGVPSPLDCDDTDPADVEPPTWYRDADGDGFGDAGTTRQECEGPTGWVANGDDCQDRDPYTGSELTFYRDADYDGYGTPFDTMEGCYPEYGWSYYDTDCNDYNPYMHPYGVLFVDTDGDGYGLDSTATDACLGVIGTGGQYGGGYEAYANGLVPVGGDCDDADAAVYPGATGEVMNDGVDTDCYGGTEIDLAPPFDGYPDLRGDCASTVDNGAYAFGFYGYDNLQSLIDTAQDCEIIHLSEGVYGHVDVSGKARALAPAQQSHPRFVALDDRPAISVHDPGALGVAVTLEGIAFEGYGVAVLVDPSVDLLASGLAFDGGIGIAATGGAGGGSVDLFDSAFSGGESAVLATGFSSLAMTRCDIDGALAIDPLVRGGDDSTTLTWLTLRDAASLAPAVLVRGGELQATGLVADGFLFGPVLDAEVDEPSAITGLTVLGAATTAPFLLRFAETPAPLGSPSITVQDLAVTDSSWEGVVGDDGLPIPGDGFVVFSGIDALVQGATFRENVYARPGPVLRAEQAPLWPVAPTRSIELYNVEIRHASVGARLEEATLTNASLADVGIAIDPVGVVTAESVLAMDCDDAADPASLGTIVWSHSLGSDCPGAPGANIDLHPLRYHPLLPEPLWDLRLHPDSDAIDAGDPATTDADGSACDVGAFGGPGGQSEVDLDGDGMYDSWEVQFFGPGPVVLPTGDPDADGATTIEEFDAGTLPVVGDTDGDGSDDHVDQNPLDPTQP